MIEILMGNCTPARHLPGIPPLRLRDPKTASPVISDPVSYLVDTNVFSEPVKAKPDDQVVTWLCNHEPELYISTVTIGELRRGIEGLSTEKRVSGPIDRGGGARALRRPRHDNQAYAEYLMAKFSRFAWAIALQVGIFSWLWTALPKTPKTEAHQFQEWGSGLHGTLNAFFSGGAATSRNEWEGWPILIFSVVVIASGCFHIGIFLSLLFSRLSRR